MRKSVMVSLIFHVLAGAAALLWLLWGFIPAGTLFKGVMTLCIVALAVWQIRRKAVSARLRAMAGLVLICPYLLMRVRLFLFAETGWMPCSGSILCVKQRMAGGCG